MSSHAHEGSANVFFYPLHRGVISGQGRFHTDKDGGQFDRLMWADILALIDNPQSTDKNLSRWIIPSTHHSRVFSEQLEHGQFHALWADLDTNPQPLGVVASVLSEILGGADFEVYATWSATEDRQKARVLVPLAALMGGPRWVLAQRAFSRLLEGNGIETDHAAHRPAQLCYLPNRGEFYDTRSCREGARFNPETVWDTVMEEIEAEDAAEAQALADERERRKAERIASADVGQAGDSLIDAFNRTHCVADILLQAGYDQRGKHFRHPNSKNGSYSAAVNEGRVHSLSSSDPLYTGGGGGGAHDAFSAFATLFHGGDQRKALKDAGDNWLTVGAESWNEVQRRKFAEDKRLERIGSGDASGHDDAAVRRKVQVEENMKIGEGTDHGPAAETITLEDALSRFVYVGDGKGVFDKKHPSHFMCLPDFKQFFASSREQAGQDQSGKRKVTVPTMWSSHPKRVSVIARSFKAGEGLFITDPEGRLAVNSWVPFSRGNQDPIQHYVDAFVEQVRLVFLDESDRFLDWLAHIEQSPGELPHTGWISIATSTGLGRNWISSVLVRLWSGRVAANFDILRMFSSGFNGRLAGKVLACVDEIKVGGAEAWPHSEKLKSIVTEETREINPKYGRAYVEYNAVRWLIFSNHLSAVPLDSNDRRWEIVINENQPCSPGYYADLYGMLREPLFVASVAHFLGTRDLSRFNPGAHARMTDSKAHVINSSKSDLDLSCEEIVSTWGSDIITTSDLYEALEANGAQKPNANLVRAVMGGVGARPFGKQVKIEGKPERVWLLRNVSRWMLAQPHEVASEVLRVRDRIDSMR